MEVVVRSPQHRYTKRGTHTASTHDTPPSSVRVDARAFQQRWHPMWRVMGDAICDTVSQNCTNTLLGKVHVSALTPHVQAGILC